MRKTKILVTLGPATESQELIERLIRTGADLIRLNMSHASHEWTRTVYAHVRQAAEAQRKDVAVLMDLTGPSIRTGDIAASWQLKPGDTVEFRTDESLPAIREFSTTVNYPGITKDLKVGDPIAIDGGMIQMRAKVVDAKRIVAEVVTGGEMKSRRHINLPGVNVNLPPLTAKDYADLDLGVELGVDYFALSFAREPAHLQHLELLLDQRKCQARVIAKIENQQALHNLDALVIASKGVMVARGDLGSECPVEDLPIIQRDIIERCSYHGRKVIVATQMLESMIENPVPTRAEVTDIFNAVTEQVDCVMLSGETSIGKYPDRCVDVLHRVITRTEERYPSGRFASDSPLKTNKHKAVKSAVQLANSIAGSKLLVFTKRGTTAHLLAHQRPEQAPIFAFTPNLAISRALMTARGVFPFVMEFASNNPSTTIERALDVLRERGLVVRGDPVVILSDVLHDDLIVDSILLREV